MKIIVLCGPGEVNKRNEMLNIKQKFSSEAIYSFDLSLNNIQDIDACLTSQSLFSSLEKLIIIENMSDGFDLKKLVKKDNSATLIVLTSNPKTTSTLITSACEINAKIMNFEAEKEISAFAYLDALIEKKQEAFFEMQKLLSIYGGMYILAMIYYLLRRNLLPLPSSSFMQKKINSQKQNLGTADFEKLYLMALNTDFNIKTGNLTENIALTKLTQEFINYLR